MVLHDLTIILSALTNVDREGFWGALLVNKRTLVGETDSGAHSETSRFHQRCSTSASLSTASAKDEQLRLEVLSPQLQIAEATRRGERR